MSSSCNDLLIGQTAVVTGSSSGIGCAVALELARAGADLLIHARENRAGADWAADEIRQLGRKARVELADLSQPTEQDRLVELAWQWRNR